LNKRFNDPDITTYIKINRLSWAGHITRRKIVGQSRRCSIVDVMGLGKLEAKIEKGGRCDPGYQGPGSEE
jgi:hypothetical protein